jgi:hypothetical protein
MRWRGRRFIISLRRAGGGNGRRLHRGRVCRRP